MSFLLGVSVIYKRNQIPSYPNLNFPVNDVPFQNPADNCVSVKFKNRGDITAIRVSVTAQTLRKRDLSLQSLSGNPADNCVSVEFTSRGNTMAIRVSVTA